MGIIQEVIEIGDKVEAFVVVCSTCKQTGCSKICSGTEKELIPLQGYVERKVREREERIDEWTRTHREAMLITHADVQQVKEVADRTGVVVEATVYTSMENPSHTQTHIHTRFRTEDDLYRFVRALSRRGVAVYRMSPVEVIA